jgi:hypothetical protein
VSGGLGQRTREALDANFGGQGHVPMPKQLAGWGEPWRRLSTGRVAPQAAARWARRGGRALVAAAVRRAGGGGGCTAAALMAVPRPMRLGGGPALGWARLAAGVLGR